MDGHRNFPDDTSPRWYGGEQDYPEGEWDRARGEERRFPDDSFRVPEPRSPGLDPRYDGLTDTQERRYPVPGPFGEREPSDSPGSRTSMFEPTRRSDPGRGDAGLRSDTGLRGEGGHAVREDAPSAFEPTRAFGDATVTGERTGPFHVSAPPAPIGPRSGEPLPPPLAPPMAGGQSGSPTGPPSGMGMPSGPGLAASAGPAFGTPPGPGVGAPVGPGSGAAGGPGLGSPGGPGLGAHAGAGLGGPPGSVLGAPAGSSLGAPAGQALGGPAFQESQRQHAEPIDRAALRRPQPAAPFGDGFYRTRRPLMTILFAVGVGLFEIPALRLLAWGAFGDQVRPTALVAGMFLIAGLPMFAAGMYGLITGANRVPNQPTGPAWLRPPVVYLAIGLVLFVSAALAAA